MLSLTHKSLRSAPNQTRKLWHWVNMMFNKIDEDRLKKFGPDRVCAEWILRNGGRVKWVNVNDYLDDYNRLPDENVKFKLKEIDATDTSISHYGFNHFNGCTHIDTLIMHKCGYIENKALQQLHLLKNSLRYLQISECGNVTDEGLKALTDLQNLETLVLFNLSFVKNKDNILNTLKSSLPKCKVDYK